VFLLDEWLTQLLHYGMGALFSLVSLTMLLRIRYQGSNKYLSFPVRILGTGEVDMRLYLFHGFHWFACHNDEPGNEKVGKESCARVLWISSCHRKIG